MRNRVLIIPVLSLVLLTANCKKVNKEEAQSAEQFSQTEELQKGEKTAYPFTITCYNYEAKPTKQTFSEPPKRIVTNNLSSIETLFELGLGDKIVGTTKPDNIVTGKWKAEIDKLDVIGNKMTISKEVILGKNPDIIVGSARGLSDDYQGSIDFYNDMGVSVFTQSASIFQHNPKLKSIIEDVRMLGQIFDVKPRAEEYAKELERKLDKIEQEVMKREKKETLYLLPIFALDQKKKTFNSFGITDGLPLDILNQLQLKSAVQIASQDNTFENLISVNPDVILYIKFDVDPGDQVKETLMREPLLRGVSAIKSKRVFIIAYDDFLDYGPRNFDTLVKLYHDIYENR